jgi:type VI secretion system protein
MAQRGLLSRLAAGQGSLAPQGDIVESVAAHLHALLNTRRGESAAAPTFGILDFNDVVHRYPSAISKMQQSIRTAIQEFEPRLKSVVVTHQPDEDDPTALRFEISAQLSWKDHRGALRFHTHIHPGGKVDVW